MPKDTLEKLCISDCRNVGGNIMELANFPRLEELDLCLCNSVTGDIRDIRECDFPALTWLALPSTVQGCLHYEFQSIAEVPDFMYAIHRLQQRTSTLFDEWEDDCGWSLSRDSPDSYWDEEMDDGILSPPLWLRCFQAGSRFGWSWCTDDIDISQSCEINWLDPEPISGSDDYDVYTSVLQNVGRVCPIFSEDIIVLRPMLRSSAVCVRITECEVPNIAVCKAYDMVEEGPEHAWLVCVLMI